MTALIKTFPNKQNRAALSLAIAGLRVEADDPALAAQLYRNALTRMSKLVKAKDSALRSLRQELNAWQRKLPEIEASDQESTDVHRRGIFLDFEGIGSVDQSCPPPHMAGIYRASSDHSLCGYTAYLFRKTWVPIKNGAPHRAELADLKEFMWSIVTEAVQRQETIYYWSQHEAKVVKSLKDDQLTLAFMRCSENLKLKAKKRVTRMSLALDKRHEKVLNQYLNALVPNARLVQSPLVGPAESCRRLDQYATKHRRWSNWTDKQKELAHQLFAYNKEDCRALYTIFKKLRNTSARQISPPNS
ncbi:hypothetical protein N9O71_00935 [bacterium]|nr:hypothetical protein [bacterium]